MSFVKRLFELSRIKEEEGKYEHDIEEIKSFFSELTIEEDIDCEFSLHSRLVLREDTPKPFKEKIIPHFARVGKML